MFKFAFIFETSESDTYHWTPTALFCSITDAVDHPKRTNCGKPNTLSILSDRNLLVLGSGDNGEENIKATILKYWFQLLLTIPFCTYIVHVRNNEIKIFLFVQLIKNKNYEGNIPFLSLHVFEETFTPWISTSITLIIHGYLFLKLPFWQGSISTNL